MDIQRILAIKRSLGRGFSTRPRMRPNTTFYAVPAYRTNTYPVRNATYTPPPPGYGVSNLQSRSNRVYPGYRRVRSLNNPFNGGAGGAVMFPAEDAAPADHAHHVPHHAPHHQYHDQHHDQHDHHHHHDQHHDRRDPHHDHHENAHSEDEIEISHPSTSSADNNNEDDNNVEQEDTSENVEDIAQSTADGAISLEEEVVEMDAAEVTVVDRDAGTSENTQNDDETQEDTSQNVDVLVPREAILGIHGVKRRRNCPIDMNPPYTIKDFNQCLLRLLECPVCLEWMEPPIAQCRRGHLVCVRCRARLASCPVCRTVFSSVRNRAMEGVAEMLRYPCRHGCGREVRLRRRAPHEASCAARKYYCPAPACVHRNPLARDMLAAHFQSKHLSMLKIGSLHNFTVKINADLSDDWLIMTLDELFHLRVDVDVHTWGVIVFVAYIGPKCNAVNYMYEVTVDGHHNARRINYTRLTHSDLDVGSLNMSRHDCFSLTLDQTINFLRFNNRNSESEKLLDFSVEVKKCIQPVDTNEDIDS